MVRAVEVYSAPRPTGNIAAATEALRQSLDELRSWQWDGARLAVEHCDALVPGRTPEKGYLPLDAEIQAVRASRGDTPLGMSINWGRSAIDERDAHAPLRHLKALKASGLLDGLMFSGATTDDPDYGDWADRHAPFDDPGKKSYLLTAERLKECLREVADTPLTYLGLKVQFLPNVLSATERVAALRRHAALLDAARAA